MRAGIYTNLRNSEDIFIFEFEPYFHLKICISFSHKYLRRTNNLFQQFTLDNRDHEETIEHNYITVHGVQGII